MGMTRKELEDAGILFKEPDKNDAGVSMTGETYTKLKEIEAFTKIKAEKILENLVEGMHKQMRATAGSYLYRGEKEI